MPKKTKRHEAFKGFKGAEGLKKPSNPRHKEGLSRPITKKKRRK